MARNPGCAVFIGNLDEKVPERVLYEILVQISGQDKPSSNANMPVTPKMNPIPLRNPPQLLRSSDTPVSQHRVVNGRIAGYGAPPSHSNDFHAQASSGVASRGLSDGTYEYSRRVFGSVLNDVNRRAPTQPVPYPSY
ncbi:uncharacterized protein LOC104582652 isoform X5 [Brachypodium distachyon]|uniref:uncharacterized protein LOC104582652 isoform X5 n=1 Tax=Brachypodium distachyon TaxID=15368 RepID=UPI0001C726B4|nr:uncharacterized protein LOC104582652 isoform X5 [Brachypodium distachyon]|eukprot:XP_010231345.1 uncharacterized protein LOC104582652 isoform X5 [Brachypodium distachyon]